MWSIPPLLSPPFLLRLFVLCSERIQTPHCCRISAWLYCTWNNHRANQPASLHGCSYQQHTAGPDNLSQKRAYQLTFSHIGSKTDIHYFKENSNKGHYWDPWKLTHYYVACSAYRCTKSKLRIRKTGCCAGRRHKEQMPTAPYCSQTISESFCNPQLQKRLKDACTSGGNYFKITEGTPCTWNILPWPSFNFFFL